MVDEEFKKRQFAEVKKMRFDKGDSDINDNEFYADWINKNAEEFERKWNISKCKTCSKCDKCGFKELNKCGLYSEDGD